MVANALADGGPIIYCNERFCQMVGFSRAEIMQKPAVSEFLHGPLTSAESISQVREVLSSTEEKQIDILYYKKDGKWKVTRYDPSLSFPLSSRANDALAKQADCVITLFFLGALIRKLGCAIK